MKRETKKYKLPSGNVRIRASYVGDDGVRHQKSFTADTLEEAEGMRSVWLKGKRPDSYADTLTVSEAVKQYIDLKAAALSPATVRGYRLAYKNHIMGSRIGAVGVSDVSSVDIQRHVSILAANYSPKTVSNVHGLLVASVTMFRPDVKFRVTLPQRKRPVFHCPSDDDIATLLDHVRKNNMPELERAIMLAAFGSLRRGEICALLAKDISGTTVHVCKCMVRDENGAYVVKAPKTYSSDRYVQMPDFFAAYIKGIKDRIVPVDPDALSNRFRRAAVATGLPEIHLHSLRHYSVSILHAIGMPDQYVMARGGFSSDGVMKSVYRNVIDIEQARQDKLANKHFEKFRQQI